MAIAFRSALRTVSLTEPWLLSLPLVTKKCPFTTQFITSYKRTSKQFPNCSCKTKIRRFSTKCSDGNDTPSSSSDDSEQGPPQEAILKAISEVSKTEGRVGQTTNMIIGGTVTDDSTNEWLTLDKKVNSYPTVRGFTAIGTGGEDFVQAMVVAVESVLQLQIPKGQVRQNISSGGKYVSVKIGPVQVLSSEQVQAVYNAMRRDDRMKYFL